MKLNACACEKCRAMCASSVCVPTPDEARTLIAKGFGPRMAVYKPFDDHDMQAVIAPAMQGREGPQRTTNGAACTFRTADGLCELHAAGLKPLEGRLAGHDTDWCQVRAVVNNTWRGRTFRAIAAELKAA